MNHPVETCGHVAVNVPDNARDFGRLQRADGVHVDRVALPHRIVDLDGVVPNLRCPPVDGERLHRPGRIVEVQSRVAEEHISLLDNAPACFGHAVHIAHAVVFAAADAEQMVKDPLHELFVI